MALFMDWVQLLLLHFTTTFPEIPGTYLIDLGRMEDWVDLGAMQWFCGDHVYIYGKWHSEVNLRQLARNFEARKILFKNVSRHVRMLRNPKKQNVSNIMINYSFSSSA